MNDCRLPHPSHPSAVQAIVVVGLLLLLPATATGHDIFSIRVIDEKSGRGVPLVELKTVNGIRYYTDSAGLVAFDEPGLMDQSIYFHVSSHGYEYPRDSFGYRGARLITKPGGEATLKIKRVNIAERIYRVTGSGIYGHSIRAGKSVPIEEPLMNGQVFGSDSVVNAVYRGKIHWFWGDTNRPSYPLGNFHVPGAVSRLPERGGVDPNQGVDLNYFLDSKGFAKPTARMPGKGPTWINGLVTLNVPDGDEALFATYVKVEPPLKIYERGLIRFNDKTKAFGKVRQFNMESPLFPGGHPLKAETEGVQYVYFAKPFPLVRCQATPSHLGDPSTYETYTCLRKGSREGSTDIVRRDGKPLFTWKTDTIPYTPKLQARLVREGNLELPDCPIQLTDDAGKAVMMHGGSVYWNEFRRRWVMIGVQSFGSSLLGEVWYAEAESLTGIWMNARKIATHDKYSFYNPKQHPMFDDQGGRVIFFEGTYTNTFSGNSDQTPRYNYNQIMYRLDLSDPALRLPSPG